MADAEKPMCKLFGVVGILPPTRCIRVFEISLTWSMRATLPIRRRASISSLDTVEHLRL